MAWYDTLACKEQRQELFALAERDRSEAEEARFQELIDLVKKCDAYNKAAEDFVNGAP
ncbi:hypothetical protein M4578_18785 [Salipiger sp. P9]|uniref:hypothetical protein n=1 Tax=Salipiger pentaromativorans TaxID=2943193 RepID=UPI002157CBE3|nr:hypothetical protein [Salipiger pentaromativorans]MCR8549879.1 hypothetical protein [Salipiger pentaromativorans]